jgi:hypothetical protein
MNHVERQNEGGHVSIWWVNTGGKPDRFVGAVSRLDAIGVVRDEGSKAYGAAQHSDQKVAVDAFILIRRALATARTESAKGGR